RLLDRDIGRLCSAQNFVDQFGGTSEQGRVAWSVSHESSGLDMVAVIEDCWQSCAERKRDDACAVRGSESITHDIKGVGLRVRLSLERFKSGRDVVRSPDFEWQDFEAEGASRSPNLAHF